MPNRTDLSFQRDRHIGYVGFGQKPQTKTPEIKEAPMHPLLIQAMEQGALEPNTKHYTMGQCRILVSPPHEDFGWHLSISHPTRYPSWDEVAKARYALLPTDLDFVMVLPKPEEYVSIHENCFQVWEEGKKRS